MSEYINIDKQFILTNINNNKLRVWLWILATACDSRCMIDGVELRSGQLLLSTREMEKVLGIGRQVSRTILMSLSKDGLVSCYGLSGKKTIITIKNYDNYVLTHFKPTLNTDNQKVIICANPLPTHSQEKATHQLTHSNVCNTTSYDIEQPTYQPTQNFEQKETKEEKENFPPYPPYKEKEESKEKFVVVDTRTREKEEKFYEDVLADLLQRKILIEAFCKNEGISEDEFSKLSRYALEEIKFKEEGFLDSTSLRNHLLNLIRIKTNNKQKQNGNEQTNIRRVGMEAIAYRPEDYKEAF